MAAFLAPDAQRILPLSAAVMGISIVDPLLFVQRAESEHAAALLAVPKRVELTDPSQLPPAPPTVKRARTPREGVRRGKWTAEV
jgi:hypothetical protein